MEFNQIETCIQDLRDEETSQSESNLEIMNLSLEVEVPEALYVGMKDFISYNEQWDQSKLISSAIVSFLFQNASTDRQVIEKYLNDVFNLSCS